MTNSQKSCKFKSKVPILMFHEVNTSNEINNLSRKIQYSFILKPHQFESQIQLLQNLGYESCSIDELIFWLSGNRTAQLPPKAIALTFDDGYEGNYKFALPILQKYGFNATFFVIVNRIGQPYMMSWKQLEELNKAGMSVQSHTLTHPLLGLLNSDEISKELTDSKKLLEDRLSRPIDFISIPYGSYNATCRKIVEDCGYKGGCTSDFGLVDFNCDPFLLTRIAVHSTCNLTNLKIMIEGNSIIFKKTIIIKKLKKMIKKTLGEQLYNTVYNYVYNVEEERSPF